MIELPFDAPYWICATMTPLALSIGWTVIEGEGVAGTDGSRVICVLMMASIELGMATEPTKLANPPP